MIYGDEKHFRIPLNPFDAYFIGLVPVVFWREALNVKKGVKFKKLYNKDFYFFISKKELFEILDKHPYFFLIQYFYMIFGVLCMVLVYFIHEF